MICGHLNNKSMKPTKRSSFLTLNLSHLQHKYNLSQLNITAKILSEKNPNFFGEKSAQDTVQEAYNFISQNKIKKNKIY